MRACARFNDIDSVLCVSLTVICCHQRYIFPTVFAKMSCMMNPLLYGLTNASLRREFRQLWHDMCCQTKSELDIEEHHCHPPRGG